jgi:hypothetical protein
MWQWRWMPSYKFSSEKTEDEKKEDVHGFITCVKLIVYGVFMSAV